MGKELGSQNQDFLIHRYINIGFIYNIDMYCTPMYSANITEVVSWAVVGCSSTDIYPGIVALD